MEGTFHRSSKTSTLFVTRSSGKRRRARLDHSTGAARRSSRRPAHGAQALRVRRGQESDGSGAGQGIAVAAYLHRWCAARLPRSPPALRRQPVRLLGATRIRPCGRKEGRLYLHEPLNWAMQATRSMQVVEMLSDAAIDEAHHFGRGVRRRSEQTAPLDAFLSLVHAFEWLNVCDAEDEAALPVLLHRRLRDPVDIAMGAAPVADRSAGLVESETSGSEASETAEPVASSTPEPRGRRGVGAGSDRNTGTGDEGDGALAAVRLAARTRPGTHRACPGAGRRGTIPQLAGRLPRRLVGLGFERTVRRLRRGDRQPALGSDEAANRWSGSPCRRPEIARAQRAADRKRMIEALRDGGDPSPPTSSGRTSGPSPPSGSRGPAEIIPGWLAAT